MKIKVKDLNLEENLNGAIELLINAKDEAERDGDEEWLDTYGAGVGLATIIIDETKGDIVYV